MNEPVGNSPRTPGDIPGNSLKNREPAPKAATPTEPPEPVTKIIEGKAASRKVPWYKRFAQNMIADDATSIGDYFLTDVLVPAVKNLISDSVRGVTDRALYGQSRVRRGGMVGDRPGLRTRYDQMSSRGEPEPRRMLSRESRSRHDFNDVVLDKRDEAIAVIDALIDRVERYGAASVSDLYDYVGVTGSYADRNYGWRDLRDADVRQVRGGFLLDLPQPELIR